MSEVARRGNIRTSLERVRLKLLERRTAAISPQILLANRNANTGGKNPHGMPDVRRKPQHNNSTIPLVVNDLNNIALCVGTHAYAFARSHITAQGHVYALIYTIHILIFMVMMLCAGVNPPPPPLHSQHKLRCGR